ncbi:conserved hypothetical protein [Leishmania major strain Friedlin]|uniref:TROVE domain-containing protein n=1 Tax=Leishmania major TaxID=5664 RepID=Q4Q983_LEIMA|nr:conserved hypothetical protein [Leishmania major strain Friedlin]CAG9576432.1 TROVE_domain_containing_protein [Leishmania major strain Friedlin]CAJ05103.1 conserved hypothetical protein [Leishmania major strain Friedlin]|eukprot:XP_001684115.1 conserved hypothetical protein [Leishmania major strain Friedlin]
MEYFYRSNAAEITPLKAALVNLVSSCLMREPPFEATRPGKLPVITAPATRAPTADEAAVDVAPAPENDGASTVAQMRELVHLISRQDGEFVLKLALYARHELHLRRSPSFLVALCAREPNCISLLQPYMEKIIVLPSDWLAVANFAYFHDCDAAHDYAGTLTYSVKTEREAHATASVAPSAAKRSPSSTGTRSPEPSAVEARSGSSVGSQGADPLASRIGAKARGDRHQGAAARDPTRSYIPAALRSALVSTFAKFSVFSMAKYDNEAAEHRTKRRQIRRDRAAAEAAVVASSMTDPAESSATCTRPAALPCRACPQTFTFKQLIRMLHITEPAYIVCCLLGKRYPTNADDFRRMRLHLTDPTWKNPAPLTAGVTSSAKGVRAAKDTYGRAILGEGGREGADDSHEDSAALPFCVFDARRAGQRMHLPVPVTWETQLSKKGNTGRVWDALISSDAVPYMALLRNLRNILTRLCSASTHKRVLDKLVDEQQVAASQQLPYRFYSAYLAVRQMGTLLVHLDALRAVTRKARFRKEVASERGRSGRGGRGGGRAAVASKFAAGAVRQTMREAAKRFERPLVPRAYLRRYVVQYCSALDSAINTSARLNVIPMKGTSIVIICVTSALFEPMSAVGRTATTPASSQRKVDVTALLVAMLMRSCEQCVVLIYCYDEYVVFRENDPDVERTALQGMYDEEVGSRSSWDTESSSSSSSRGNDFDNNGAVEGDFEAMSNTLRKASAKNSQKGAPGLMGLVSALTARCSSLLERKREEVGPDGVATSFAMFADAADAQFPYAFLDEVIERNMRIESLLVFDEGVHRTYANMNRNAPAFGDLPTYLSRLRRTCSPDLVYVGVNLKASNPPAAEGVAQAPGATVFPVTASAAGAPAHRKRGQVSEPSAKSGAAVALQQAEVKLRFGHRNDVLLTGFSDSILRLVAERTGGGPLAVIERAAETYHVSRLSARASQAAWEERTKALKVLAALREGHQSHIGGGGGSLEALHAPGAFTFDDCLKPLTQSSTATTFPMQSSSHPSTARSLVAEAMAAPAVALPFFDGDGKAVSATGRSWDCSSRSSDRRLQWLTSRIAGQRREASDAGTPSKGRTALPSIRRLLAKPSLSESAVATPSASGAKSSAGEAVDPARHWDSGETREIEPAWLAAEGKNVSSVFHPQPFISILKLFSMSSSKHGDSTTASAASDAASVDASATACVAAMTTLAKTASTKSVARHRLQGPASHPLLPTASAVARRLITSYRVCRFFISSTFLDMNNERNAIALDIFPRLRRWAAEAGLKATLLEVDLRWGIPALATSRNLSTSVCLNEVSRCSPFFIGIIGARYGTSPPTPLQLVVDEDVDAEDYAWMRELSDPHVSVTELEMRHAMYNTKRRVGCDGAPWSALFFARDSPHLLSSFGPADSACRAVYEADSDTSTEAIERLKKRITESGCKLVSYQAAYISPAKTLLPGNSGRSSGGAPHLAGGSIRSAAMCSGARAMMEDDLGRWAARSRRGFGDGAGQAASSISGKTSEADSLGALVTARITESEERKRLTSMDVAIDMTDFSSKVFHELQEVICRVCGVRPGLDDSAAEKQRQQHADACVADVHAPETDAKARRCARSARSAVSATSGATAAEAPDMYEMLVVAQSEFARKLSDLYAAPRGLLEQLSSFALNGTLGVTDESDVPSDAGAVRQRGVAPHGTKRQESVTLIPSSESAYDTCPVRGFSLLPPQQRAQHVKDSASSGGGTPCQPLVARTGALGGGTSSILLLEGCDGDGKSSALAALTALVLEPMQKASASEATPRFLFYSTQAEDDSVHGLLLFLAKSLCIFFQLYGEVSVQDTDAVDELLLVLDHAYAAIHRHFETSTGDAGTATTARGGRGINGGGSVAGRAAAGAGHAALVVVLDGLDKSSEAAELVSLLGTILHPLATQHIRFVVSACPRSPLARALRTRTPPAHVLTVPILSEAERAELVRLHLANYGKVLEESFTADELKNLLRKSGAGRPSYLISAITHLRLFSTFDTLREDIRLLPASRAALHEQLFQHLQARFDPATCRVVLSILLLRQPVGGVLEFNLYRLVSDVAAASRLVTLLRGICLDTHHGRLFIKSSTFVDAVARRFFRFASDYQCVQERVLLAELCYQPIDVSLDEQEVKVGLRQVAESIRRSAANPLTRRTFVPERYAPRELLGVLQGSVQACRLDVTAALACYLPFLECLLVSRRMLSQLIGLLSSVVSATTSASSSAPGAPTATGAAEAEDDADAEDSGSIRPLASYRALALPWRHYRSDIQHLGYVLEILQKNHHVLLRQPALLRQCVWNTVGPAMCISAYDAASTARLRHALHRMTTTSKSTASCEVQVDPQGERRRSEDAALHSPAARSPDMPTFSVLSTMWVHWLNARQHGGEGRVMLTTVSPQSIRCMAMSPDGTEVAVGGDDGILRRMSADEDEQQQLQQSQLAPKGTESAGSAGVVGRRRVASTLRHESAVTSVLYVNPRTAGGPTAGTNGTGAPATLAAPTGVAQLLVSGCARGLLYVWSLEDNSLLQRGTGHLRAISGLVCHPLEPLVLCSCSHDSLIMLWGVGAAEATSRLCSEVQAALALRMPKYPADSAERLQHERLQQRTSEEKGNGELCVGGGGAGSTVVWRGIPGWSTGIRSRQTPFQASLMPFHTERQHHTPVAAIAFHGSGDIFASGSWDGVLVLHDTRELCAPSSAITPEMNVPCEPPNQTRLTSRRSRRAKVVWRTRRGPERRQVTFQSMEFELGSSVRALSFANSLAVTCVVGCHNGTVVVVDHASAAVVARWTSLHSAPVTRLTTSLDGRCVASADEHGVVRLTHTGITGSVFATFNGHHGAVTGLCFRPPRAGHGEDVAGGADALQAPPVWLLTAGEDRTLQAWRVDSSGSGSFKTQTATSRRRLIAAHCTAVTAVASSRDGQLVVTGSADGTAIVFRVPEEIDDDDDIVYRGACGAATGMDCAGTTAWDRPKAVGKKASPDSSTAAGNAQTTLPLKPAFTLRHDDCRITCIRLALRDTRIVVGVVFGLVYVWSSSPGLNQVEGRLLLRVRVPEHGLYPVVSLSMVERCSATAMNGNRGKAEARKGGIAQQTRGAETTLPLANPLQPARTHTRSSAVTAAIAVSSPTEKEDESSTLVTAVCANGDVAIFKLLSDAASLVMAADQARRRQRQQRHQIRATYCATGLVNGVFPRSNSTSYASSADTLKRSAEDVGVAVSTPASKSLTWVERVENGGKGGGVAPRAGSTATASNSTPCVREAGPAAAQVGRWRPMPPTTDCAARRRGGASVAVSATPAPQAATFVEAPRRRQQALDRRARKLQRLLSRCRETEVELCSSFRLHLHRYRLHWENVADAEEITSVVWLNAQHPQLSLSADAADASAAVLADALDVEHARLALVVAQRQLFLLCSNGHESALSGCLTVRVPSRLPGSSSVLKSVSGTMPKEGMAVGAPVWGASGDGTNVEGDVVPPEAVEAAATEEFEVDLGCLLRDDEYFTSSSSAVAVAPPAPSAVTAVALRWFAVAISTSQGEVLLLRVQVPHDHEKHSDTLGTPTTPFTGSGARPPTAASHHLSTNILPRTSITLCRRLSFTGSIVNQAAAAERDETEAGTSGAALHRNTAVPRATCVELCTLPPELGTSLDASAPSLPLDAAATVMERVALFAGCTDGSARVWLAAAPPVVPHARRASPAGIEMDETPAQSRIDGASDAFIGCFYCTSSVTVVSGLLNYSVPRASGGGVSALVPSSRWIVGDTLGNVYQLRLERDPPGGVAALLSNSCDMLTAAGGGARSGNAEVRMTRAAAENIHAEPWARSLQRLTTMMSSAPPASAAGAMQTPGANDSADEGCLAGGRTTASEAVGTLAWPGWSSHSSENWLAPVDVSSALPTLLRRAASATGVRADATSEWRNTNGKPRTAMLSPSVGAADRTPGAGDATLQLSTAAPFCSTLVSFPPVQWSCLPDLPSVQRAGAAVVSSATGGAAEDVTARGSDGPAHLTWLGGIGLSSPPTALPSFATGPRASQSVLERQGADNDGGEFAAAQSFQVPLTSLLARYRSQGAGTDSGTPVSWRGETAAAVRLPRRGKANPSVHVEVPALPLPKQLLTQGDRQHHLINADDEDEEDYFAVLYTAEPLVPQSPCAGGSEARRAWLLHQQEVLKEAMRVQRYNKLARRALEAYQRRTATAMGL